MIPKQINIIWLGNKEPNIPYLDKIKEMYFDYKIKIWRDEDFDFSNANSFVKKAIELKKWSFVTDYYRMKILFEEGGIHLDADMEPINKINDNDLNDFELIGGYEYRYNITMGFLASQKGNAFIKNVIDYYDNIQNCNFFPLGNLVWTEILYNTYENIGYANKTKIFADGKVKLYDFNSFGLWRPKKNKESFFIHRHDIGWIDNKLYKWLIHTGAKISYITPVWVSKIMEKWQGYQTKKRTFATSTFEEVKRFKSMSKNSKKKMRIETKFNKTILEEKLL